MMTASAQSKGAGNKSFDDFRNSMLSGYQEYRSAVLANYAKFLNGIWDDYKQFKGEERDSAPKPPDMPDIAEMPPLPIPDVPEEPEDDLAQAPDDELGSTPVDEPATPEPVGFMPTVPDQDKTTPRKNGERSKKALPGFLDAKPQTTPMLPDLPPVAYTPRTLPAVEEDPALADGFQFDFYEIPLAVAENDLRITNSITSNEGFGAQWSALSSDREAKSLLRELKSKADNLALNDYLTYELVKSYVQAKYPRVDAASRISLMHYLLANMGYDVRLGTGANGKIPMLLMTFEQMVYSRPYLKLDNKMYFLFPESDSDLKQASAAISTCRLPKDANLGKVMDLRVTPLNLPYKAHPYEINYGGIQLKGEVNGNLFPMMFRYPQMPISDYAQSALTLDTRQEIVKQMSEQLQGLPEKDAVNKLLHFVQKGFKYATDDVAHGFEKPYFFEELLYYPTCDCEDRSVFYSYLLWNVLDVQNHIINYPGHESVSVMLSEPVNGSGYDYDGGLFNISDPTYIGASTGQCMPSFSKTTPKVDYIYR